MLEERSCEKSSPTNSSRDTQGDHDLGNATEPSLDPAEAVMVNAGASHDEDEVVGKSKPEDSSIYTAGAKAVTDTCEHSMSLEVSLGCSADMEQSESTWDSITPAAADTRSFNPSIANQAASSMCQLCGTGLWQCHVIILTDRILQASSA